MLVFYCCISAANVEISGNWHMQEQSNWCWAASAQNSVRHIKGTSRSQTEAAAYIFGTAQNKGAENKQTASAAEYMSWNTLDYSYTTQCRQKNYAFLKKEIDLGYIPIAVYGFYYNGQSSPDIERRGHAVDITGYNNDNGKYLYYYNPFDGSKNYCSFSAFSDGSYNGGIYDGTIYNDVC